MPFVITCSLLSFVIVLFLRSFFKRKSAFAGSNEIENPGIKSRVFDISSTAIGAMDSGCKAYVIQSLYSRHFIFPEDAGFRKYEFRSPLPSFSNVQLSYSDAAISCEKTRHDDFMVEDTRNGDASTRRLQ